MTDSILRSLTLILGTLALLLQRVARVEDLGPFCDGMDARRSRCVPVVLVLVFVDCV